MSNYVESGYVQSGYIEGDAQAAGGSSDNAAILNAIDVLNTVVSEQNAIISQLTQTVQSLNLTFQEQKTAVQQNTTTLQTQNTLLLEVNNKIIGLEQDISDLKSSQITLDQYKETVPQVNDQSIFVHPIGTKVCFVAAPDMYLIVRGSRFLNTNGKAYLYELYYELQVEGTEKYSLIAASAIQRYVEDSGGN